MCAEYYYIVSDGGELRSEEASGNEDNILDRNTTWQQQSGSDEQSSSSNYWSDSATLFLIATLKESNYFGDSGKKKVDLQKKASALLAEAGFVFTYLQVSGRIKTLLESYRKVKDHNSKSGNNRKTCKFYNEMEDLLGDRPTVKPVAPCSSQNPRQTITGSCSSVSTEDIQETKGARKMRVRGKGGQSKRTATMAWLTSYEAREAERERARLEELRLQHMENKQLLRELIDTLKNK